MKKTIYLPALLIMFLGCIHTQAVEIISDTININIKGDMTQAVIYDNKYYCFFELRSYYGGKNTKLFYMLLPDGTIEYSAKVPEEINDETYYDLHIRNDSIIVKTYWNHNSYYFDREKLEWTKIGEVDDIIFEDDKFYVTALDFGEWGGTVWFRDKKTNIEYETYSVTPVINKLNGIYYLTGGREVSKIEDPLKMKMCDQNNSYQIIKNNKKHFEASNSTLGLQTIFLDSTYSFKPTFYIATSFISDNQLHHLCVSKDTAYIATIKDGKMIPLETISNNMNIYNYHYSYRNRILTNNSQTLRFNTDTKNLFGLIQIRKNKIFIHYIKNEYPSDQAPIGLNKADSLFNLRLNNIISNIENLDITQVTNFEMNIGSEDITPSHLIGLGSDYYPNPKKYKLDAFKCFLIKEDSILTNKVEYFYTKKDNLIKVVLFEWDEGRNNAFFLLNKDNKIITALFQNRLNSILQHVNQKLGEPITRNYKLKKYNNKDDNDTFWETSDGMIVKLYSDDLSKFKRIRMVIYKE